MPARRANRGQHATVAPPLERRLASADRLRHLLGRDELRHESLQNAVNDLTEL